MHAQTSDRISKLAARYAGFNAVDLDKMSSAQRLMFASDVRSMAASLLRQDEHRGLRGLLRRVKRLANSERG